MKRLIISVLLIGVLFEGASQINAFATARLSRRSVYPQEPLKVTIRVSTATWFTNPLDFANIQIPNAFVLPFKRTQSMMHKVNEKKYAALEFYFLVYPYEAGNYEFPPLEIIAETPPEGDYKGQKVPLTTKAVPFEVKAIPEKYEGEAWFVAKALNIYEQWNKPLDQIKVGDVIERTVTLDATGCLPNFIPASEYEDLDFANVYLQTPTLNDKRTTQDVNGSRVEKTLYLFDKAGTYEIPPLKVQWWNPYAKKVYYKELLATEVTVHPNPDLGMLVSIQDSLDQTSAIDKAQGASTEIFGWIWWQFLLAVGGGLFILIAFIRWMIILFKTFKERKARYVSSEKYLFDQINKQTEPQSMTRAIYKWWDIFREMYGYGPSLHQYLAESDANMADKWPLQKEGQDMTCIKEGLRVLRVHAAKKKAVAQLSPNQTSWP